MFFIMGITDGRKDFDFSQTVICDNCGFETSEDFDFCPKCGTRF